MSNKPSPRPWSLGRGYEQQEPGVYISDAEGVIVYADDNERWGAAGENLSEADAELVVRAVNKVERLESAARSEIECDPGECGECDERRRRYDVE